MNESSLCPCAELKMAQGLERSAVTETRFGSLKTSADRGCFSVSLALDSRHLFLFAMNYDRIANKS
jgi:hypothetical protein